MTVPLVSRSVDAITAGEQVTIHRGYDIIRGEWMGITRITNPAGIIAVPYWTELPTIIHVLLDGDDEYVTDGCGRVIRRTAPTPDFPAGY